MKIDFILPVKVDNEKRYHLAVQTLTTFFLATPINHFNRLIIVDDCSTYEDFREELSSPDFLESKLILNYINTTQLGVGGSKNKGVELAKNFGRGDMLYFMDSDVFYTYGWIDKLIEAYEQNSDTFKIIGAGIHPYLQPRQNESSNLLTSHDAVSGWSWLLSYETWDKYGKLADNSLGTGKSEDWEYCQRVRNDGFKVGCLINQVVAHCGLTNSEGNQIPGYNESKILAERVAPNAMLI